MPLMNDLCNVRCRPPDLASSGGQGLLRTLLSGPGWLLSEKTCNTNLPSPKVEHTCIKGKGDLEKMEQLPAETTVARERRQSPKQ